MGIHTQAAFRVFAPRPVQILALGGLPPPDPPSPLLTGGATAPPENRLRRAPEALPGCPPGD
eukprot:6517874-Alexandrium_andersonii.AAC.1